MADGVAHRCPSCREAMSAHRLPAVYGGEVEVDFCFGCHGLWFDPQESQKLAPEAIATMFRLMHAQRDAAHRPLAGTLHCPQCEGRLLQGFDVVRSGRYVTHRCENRHGRYSSFSAFMIEKGFVRQLSRPEIADIAKKVGVIHCSSCGAPVDLRREDACSHCRSPLSLLDPQAVEKALQAYAQTPSPTAAQRHWGSPDDVADVIVAMEKERLRAQREDARQALDGPAAGFLGVDLFSAGLALFNPWWRD